MAAMLALLTVVAPGPAWADARLKDFLGQAQPAELVPGSDRFGPAQGDPPSCRRWPAISSRAGSGSTATS